MPYSFGLFAVAAGVWRGREDAHADLNVRSCKSAA